MILHDAAFKIEMTTEGLDAFTHAAQTIALAGDCLLPIILDY